MHPGEAMKRWEYVQLMMDGSKVLVEDVRGTHRSEDSFVFKMNELGREGWELISVYKIGERPIYVFKRQKDLL
jgi:hypothetical protein